MTRGGFTLIELLVALVVASMLGVGLTRMLISDSRFVGRQDAMLSARGTARSAMNVMTTELRMVGDSGLVAAAAESVTVRVPYAFGMACQRSGSSLYASLLPMDSLTFARAAAEGLAWRTTAGHYVLVERSLTTTITSDSTHCQADSIRIVAGGAALAISSVPGGQTPPPGSIFHLYEIVTYRFAPSVEVPGRIALWRRAGALDEEIAVPFDPQAGFGFLVGVNLVAQGSPPADLRTVRGLELRLIGASEGRAPGVDTFETYDLVTQVPFLNLGGLR